MEPSGAETTTMVMAASTVEVIPKSSVRHNETKHYALKPTMARAVKETRTTLVMPNGPDQGRRKSLEAHNGKRRTKPKPKTNQDEFAEVLNPLRQSVIYFG